MLQEERQNIILNHIHLHHKVTTNELCGLLKVSIDTVRRDLSELEKEGKLIKVHGGAISKSFHLPFQQPQVYAEEEKKGVAQKALSLIKDGMLILTGGGTIILELARMFPKNWQGIFFTVSPLVALEVAQRSTAKVILLGGEVTHDSYICTGATVISQLSEINTDLCFLGANGLSPNEGLTDTDWEVVQVKKALIKAAAKTAVLSIEEKLDTIQRIRICDLNTLDYLVTRLKPSESRLMKYAKSIKII